MACLTSEHSPKLDVLRLSMPVLTILLREVGPFRGAQHRAAASPSTSQLFVLSLDRQSRSSGSPILTITCVLGINEVRCILMLQQLPAVAYHTCMGAETALGSSPSTSVKRIWNAKLHLSAGAFACLICTVMPCIALISISSCNGCSLCAGSASQTTHESFSWTGTAFKPLQRCKRSWSQWAYLACCAV